MFKFEIGQVVFLLPHKKGRYKETWGYRIVPVEGYTEQEKKLFPDGKAVIGDRAAKPYGNIYRIQMFGEEGKRSCNGFCVSESRLQEQ